MILELGDDRINELQRKSILRLIERAKSAHHVDIYMRIGARDERIQADWLKHLKLGPANER